MREIILDTETTGLNPLDGHRIIEIGAIELINGNRTGKDYHQYINPQRDVPQEAYAVHGLGISFLEKFPVFSEIAQEFLQFISDAALVIHNAPFDLKFLNHELKCMEKNLSKHKIVDTLQIARKRFPGSPASLDALCKRFKIDNTQRIKHGALLDCELLADVYIELQGGAQKGLKLNATTQQEKINTKKVQVEHVARSFPRHKKEEQNHENFLKTTLPSHLWKKS